MYMYVSVIDVMGGLTSYKILFLQNVKLLTELLFGHIRYFEVLINYLLN